LLLSLQQLRKNIETKLDETLIFFEDIRKPSVDSAKRVLDELLGVPNVAPIQSTLIEDKKVEYKKKILENFEHYAKLWNEAMKIQLTGSGSGSSLSVFLDSKTGKISGVLDPKTRMISGEGKPVTIAAGRALRLIDYNTLHGTQAEIVFLEMYPNGSNDNPVVENEDAAIVLGAFEMLLQETKKKVNLEDLHTIDRTIVQNKLDEILNTSYQLKTTNKPGERISVRQATKTDKVEKTYTPVVLTNDNGHTRLLASIGAAVAQKAKWIVASEASSAEKNYLLPFVQVTNDGNMHFIIPYDLKKEGFLNAVKTEYLDGVTDIEQNEKGFMIKQKDVENFMTEVLGFDNPFVKDLTSVYTSIETPVTKTYRSHRGQGNMITEVDKGVFEPKNDRV
jgi:hypothetical protein